MRDERLAFARFADSSAADDARRTRFALQFYDEARAIAGTPCERYLVETHGIPKRGTWPGDLRFHPHCPRGSARLPAMAGRMRDIATNAPKDAQRTYLTADGVAKDTGDGGEAQTMLGPSCVTRDARAPTKATSGCARLMQPCRYKV